MHRSDLFTSCPRSHLSAAPANGKIPFPGRKLAASSSPPVQGRVRRPPAPCVCGFIKAPTAAPSPQTLSMEVTLLVLLLCLQGHWPLVATATEDGEPEGNTAARPSEEVAGEAVRRRYSPTGFSSRSKNKTFYCRWGDSFNQLPIVHCIFSS